MMNKIICGDVLEELEKFESDSIDLIITSPPYFQQRKYTDYLKEIGTEPGEGLYIQMLYAVFSHCFRIIKPTGSIAWNMGDVYQNKSLRLLPYRFALGVVDHYRTKNLKLINDITWVKSNPTPRQYNKRLICSTEPFFHFVKSDDYYYNIEGFLKREKKKVKVTGKKGERYYKLIEHSGLSDVEKAMAELSIMAARREMTRGEITDFRMKIRGIHKKAFGGQEGGRNNQIERQGFTLIKFKGGRIKRDVIETPVANTRNIDHPAVFPCKVIEELVSLLSKENDVVLDPFCGSGQVCLVAKSLNRKYLGIDLNSKYCELTRKRLQ